MDIQWENTEIDSKDDCLKVTRRGHAILEDGLSLKAIDPETFKCVYVTGRVPMAQRFMARKSYDSILTEPIIDFEALKKGEYAWDTVAFESIEIHKPKEN